MDGCDTDSTREREAWSLFADALAKEHEHGRLRPRDLLILLSTLLGERIEAGDASRYIYAYGRQMGYDLPPYPLAGCGEIREFFTDEGVSSVPEWYEKKLGIDQEAYLSLAMNTIVVIRDAEHRRTSFLVEGIAYSSESGFANLAESDLIKHLSAVNQVALADKLLKFLVYGFNEDGLKVF